MSPSPRPSPSGSASRRGLGFLIGLFLTLVVLLAGSVMFGGAPDGAIRAPNVLAGGER